MLSYCFNFRIIAKYISVLTITISICSNVTDVLGKSEQVQFNDNLINGSKNQLMYSNIGKVCDLLSMDSEIVKMEYLCNEIRFINSILLSVNAVISYDESFMCKRSMSKVLVNEKPAKEEIYSLRTHNIIESIADLMTYWKRFKGAFFYDEFAGIEANTQRYLRLRSIDAELIHITSTNNISEDLLSVIKKHQNIIILCNNHFTDAIFIEVKLLNLFKGNYTWIVTGNNVPETLISVDIAPNAQVTLMSPRIVKDHKSSIVAKPPLSIEHRNVINWWLKKHEFCKSIGTNTKVEILVNQRDKIPAFLKYSPDIDILDVFFSLASNATETVKFAHWNQISKLFMLETPDKRDKKRRLKGRRIRMDVFQESEMGMNVLAMTPGRRLGVRYVGPVTKAHFAIVYNRPDPIIPPTTYLLPFTLLVWIVIFASLALIVAAIFLVMTISPFSKNHVTQSEKIHSMSFRLITFTYLEEVFEYPPGPPSKVVYGTLLLAVLAIFAHYTSIFTSFLAYQEEKIPFETLEDVVKNRDYQVLIVNKTRHQDVLQTAKDGVYAMVWKRILEQGDTSFEYSFESGMNKMKTGMYSYISDGPTCTFLSGGNCSIAFGPLKYYQEYYNMAHRRDFPYTRMFSISLMQIMESGIFRRLTLFYNLDSRPPCNFEGNSLSFGINQVVGVFFVYGCGILLAFLVLVVERHLPQRYQQIAIQKIVRPKVSNKKHYAFSS